MTTSYGGFTATYRATMATSANPLIVGTPFNGSLTMTDGGTSWTLPKPSNPGDSLINQMCVIAFQRELNPGVMIEGYTDGAHCCELPVIYLFNRANNRYVKVVDMSPNHYRDPHAFNANEGFFPKVVGHQVLLQTSDGAFPYTFACYACGISPIVLDAVGLDGLTDVTGRHPSLVEADAKQSWSYVQSSIKAETAAVPKTIPFPFGFLAPWVADECTLGHGATAWSTVEAMARKNELSNALYYKATMTHRSFVPYLHSFLLHDDYCTGQI
jgi:hypothetical protein